MSPGTAPPERASLAAALASLLLALAAPLAAAQHGDPAGATDQGAAPDTASRPIAADAPPVGTAGGPVGATHPAPLSPPAPPSAAAQGAPASALAINRVWDVLPAPAGPAQWRQTMRRAGQLLGGWSIDLSGQAIDGQRLRAIAASAPREPFTRVVREALRQPIDVEDFLLFVDDVLAAGRAGLRGQTVWVSGARARSHGIYLHPDDIFFGRPRLYGARGGTLPIDRPRPPDHYPLAEDGEPLGPRWTGRYPNPGGEKARLRALHERAPAPDFGRRIESLLGQLRAQGVSTWVTATLRRRERGYLMWGAFVLGRASDPAQVTALTDLLDARNREWGLGLPITWRHPDGWQATVEAARQMADTYDVVYATENGARRSRHYDGVAVDLVANFLPRRLRLRAPDGTTRRFDLSGPEQPRDLNLTREVIEWLERHFGLRKLRSDHPHWDDDSPEARAFIERQRAADVAAAAAPSGGDHD